MTKTKLKEVVIDRNTWGTGSLFRPNGTMCCLGFVAKQVCGLDNMAIEDRGYLSDLLLSDIESAKDLLKRSPITHRKIENDLTRINDSYRLSDVEKERRIIKLGRQGGIRFRFMGKKKEQP